MPLVNLDSSLRRLLKKSKQPRWIEPMEPTVGGLSKGDWVFEPVLGERFLINKRDDVVFILSMARSDVTPEKSELASWFAGHEGDFILEGEYDGEHFYVSDVLYTNGYDLRGLSLLHRKAVLHNLLRFDEAVKFKPYYKRKEHCQKSYAKGCVAKEVHSSYSSRRSRFWREMRNIIN